MSHGPKMPPTAHSPRRPHARPASPPPPALPLPVLELILVLAPRTVPATLVSAHLASQLLCVLPRAAAPTVVVSAMVAAGTTGALPVPLPATATDSLLNTDLGLVLARTNATHPSFGPLRARVANAAACRADASLLSVLESEYELVSGHSDLTQVVDAACASGALKVLEWLESSGFDLTMCSLDGILGAVKGGHVAVLALLAKNGRIEAAEVDVITKQACISGQKHVLEYALDAFEDWFDWYPVYWDLASEHGHVELLKWAKSHRFQDSYTDDHYSHAFDLASARGKEDVLEWWLLNGKKLIYSVNALDEASANGHMHVLEWFALSGLEMKFTPAAKARALANGHWRVVQFWSVCGAYKFLASSSDEDDPDDFPHIPKGDPVTLAAFGHLKWIQQLHDKMLSLDSSIEWEIQNLMISKAIQFGHVHILDAFPQLVEQAMQEHEASETFAHPLVTAVAHSQLSALQWCFAHVSHAIRDMPDDTAKACAATAMDRGHLDVLCWLLGNAQYRSRMSAVPGMCVELISAAVDKADINILELLWCEYIFKATAEFILHTFQRATHAGHVPVLDWCASKNTFFPADQMPDFSDRKPLWTYFQQALVLGRIDVVEWWFAQVCSCLGTDSPGVLFHARVNAQDSHRLVLTLMASRQVESLQWLQRHQVEMGVSDADRRLITEALSTMVE